MFGEEHEVNKVCDAILTAVQKAKMIRAKENAWKKMTTAEKMIFKRATNNYEDKEQKLRNRKDA